MKNGTAIDKNLLVVFASIVLCAVAPVEGQDLTSEDKVAYTKDSYTYKIVEGHEILADVYRHPGEEIRPAIIWIHGGALIFGSRTGLSSAQLEQYLEAGYAVIAIDYRLAPETKLAAIIEDLEDAYAWVRTKGPGLFNIDPDRVAVVGHSAGGYLTLMAGVRFTPRPRALVSFYGYGDITGSWYSQPDPFYNQRPPVPTSQAFNSIGNSPISAPTARGRASFYLYCRQKGIWPREVSGHDPVKEYPWFRGYEPLRNVTSDYPPTMLLHGERDRDVPFQQSASMAQAFELHDIDYEFVRSADWGHGFDGAGMGDSAVQGAFDRVLAFLEKNLR